MIFDKVRKPTAPPTEAHGNKGYSRSAKHKGIDPAAGCPDYDPAGCFGAECSACLGLDS